MITNTLTPKNSLLIALLLLVSSVSMTTHFVSGFAEGCCADLCQQTGHQGFHVCSRNQSTSQSNNSQGPSMAYTGLLCSNWRRVSRGHIGGRGRGHVIEISHFIPWGRESEGFLGFPS